MVVVSDQKAVCTGGVQMSVQSPMSVKKSPWSTRSLRPAGCEPKKNKFSNSRVTALESSLLIFVNNRSHLSHLLRVCRECLVQADCLYCLDRFPGWQGQVPAEHLAW